MLIVILAKTKEVIAFMGEYDPNLLVNENILRGTDYQGKQVEETNANERFDFIDGLTVDLPLDDAGNLESYRKDYWCWIDGQLIRNLNYVDPDRAAEIRKLEADERKEREALLKQLQEDQINAALSAPSKQSEAVKEIASRIAVLEKKIISAEMEIQTARENAVQSAEDTGTRKISR